MNSIQGRFGVSRFVRKAVVAALAVAAAGVAEAKWTCSWIDGWFVVFSDGTWTIQCTRGTVTDADGTTYASPHIFNTITKAPEGGGDLDMSTLWEDVLEQKPTYTFDGQAPVGMYGNFYQQIANKKVTSIKFPSCLRVVSGWSASYSTPEYNGCTTNVVFNEGLNTLAGGFLSYMTNLVTVSGLDTVRHVGDYAFHGCSKLQTIDPFLPTSVVTVSSKAFNGCNVLTGDLVYQSPEYRTVSVSPGKPTSVTYCEGVTNIASGWGFCTSLTNVAPYPASLQTISGGFYETKGSLGRLDFSACTNLTEIRQDFAPYSSVAEVILPPRIRTIGNSAFRLCMSLTNVGYVADMRFRDEMLSASGVVGSQAFDTCTHLRSVTLPWGGGDTEIKTNAFIGCWNFKRLKFEGCPPKTYPSNLFDRNTATQSDGPGSYYTCIYASPRQDRAAWRSFATRAPTDAEKAKSTYPGSKTFGVFEYDYTNESAKRSQWLVWEKSCWDLPQGMMLLFR